MTAREALSEKLERLIETISLGANTPKLWTAAQVAAFFGVHEKTARSRIICRPGFPRPTAPCGDELSERRWFSDEVIEFARTHRAALPRARQRRQSSSFATSAASRS
jgi:hypothetical protein